MSKKVNTKANEVVEDQNKSAETKEGTTVVAKPMTFAERRAQRKEEIALDKQLHPENYTVGAKVKKALPYVGTALAGVLIGFLGNALIKEDDDDGSTVNYVDMTDETEAL